jgi:hypothetical protein
MIKFFGADSTRRSKNIFAKKSAKKIGVFDTKHS